MNSDDANYGEAEWNYVHKFLLEEGVLHTQGATWNDFEDLEVTEKSSPDMSVDIGIGTAVIEITRSSETFKVFAMNIASANVAVTSNSTGSNRVDPVIMRIDIDTDPNALMNNIATLEVLVGTGTSAMSDSAIQSAIGSDGFARLADITVENSETLIQTADISDTRVRSSNNDAVLHNPSTIQFRVLASDPSGGDLQEGLFWFNSTSNFLKYYNGSSVVQLEAVGLATDPGLEWDSGNLRVKVATGGGITRDSTGLSADITRYETFAVGEGVSDGEACILRDDVEETFTTGTDSHNICDVSANTYVSQGFQIPVGTQLTKATLSLKLNNSPTQDLRAYIYSDSGGDPNASLGYGDIEYEAFSSSFVDLIVSFDNISLTADTQYHIVLSTADNSVSATNYFVSESSSTGGYSYGSCKVSSDGSSWSASGSYDLHFTLYYNAMMKADNNDDARNEGFKVAVANEAISIRTTGEFIMEGLKTGFTFDPVTIGSGSCYNRTSTDSAISLIDAATLRTINQKFNAGSYTQITAIRFVMYKTGVPTNTISCKLYSVDRGLLWTGTLSASDLGTGTGDSIYLYPYTDVLPGEMLYCEFSAGSGSTSGDTVKMRRNNSSVGLTQYYMYFNATGYQYNGLNLTVTGNRAVDTPVGSKIYVSTTAGDVANTGSLLVGEVIDNETLLVGKGLENRYLNTESASILYDAIGQPYTELRAPLGAEYADVHCSILGASNYNNADVVRIYKVGNDDITLNHYTASGSYFTFNLVWSGHRIKCIANSGGTSNSLRASGNTITFAGYFYK